MSDLSQPRAGGEGFPIVVFVIGEQTYGLPVGDVVEVVRLPALLALSGAPPYLCGLLNRRGAYLPVLDGRALLGDERRYALSQQVLILSGGGSVEGRLGLLVDEVRGIAGFRPGQLTPCAEGTATPLLRGILNAGSASLLLLDADQLAQLALAPQVTA